MLLHRQNEEEEEPCRHMRLLISGESDGTLSGILAWFTRHHLKGCPRCRRGLRNLIALREKLHALGSPEIGKSVVSEQLLLTPERRAAIEQAWAKIDESA